MKIDKRKTRVFAVITGILSIMAYGFISVLGFGVGMIDFSDIGRAGLVVLLLIGISLIFTFVHDLVASIAWYFTFIGMILFLVFIPIYELLQIVGYVLSIFPFGVGSVFLIRWIRKLKTKSNYRITTTN